MERSIEDRIEAMFDQLENPSLSEDEIETIERKVRFLHELKAE